MTKEKTWNCSNFNWLDDTDAVISFIENLKSDRATGTISGYFNGITSTLQRLEGYQHLAKKYKPSLIKWSKLYKEEKGKNILTNREKPNYMPWSQIVKYNDKKWLEEERLLFKLYTAIPPRRNLDYSMLKYVKNKSLPKVLKLDKTYNYISVESDGTPKAIVINNYKTHKLYKTYIINLNQKNQGPHFRYSEISKAIVAWAKAENVKTNEFVFPNYQGTVYTTFTPQVNNLFKNTHKLIGVNILRHSFISSFLENNPNASDNTIKVFSDAMGNSVNQFRQYRRIDAEKDDGDD
jgi:hypothetical protein